MPNYGVFTNTRDHCKISLGFKMNFWVMNHLPQQKPDGAAKRIADKIVPLTAFSKSFPCWLQFLSKCYSAFIVCEPPPSCCPQTGSCSFCPWSTEGSLWLACSSSSPPSKWRGYMADPCFLCYLFVWRNRSGAWVGLQRRSIKQRHFIFATV